MASDMLITLNLSMLKTVFVSPMSQHTVSEKIWTAVDTQITKWRQGTTGLYHRQSEVEEQWNGL